MEDSSTGGVQTQQRTRGEGVSTKRMASAQMSALCSEKRAGCANSSLQQGGDDDSGIEDEFDEEDCCPEEEDDDESSIVLVPEANHGIMPTPVQARYVDNKRFNFELFDAHTLRLRGGYTPKKSRKSKSKRRPLAMKYKIEKKVKAHHRALRRENRDKEAQKLARKKGLDVKPTKKEKKQIKKKMAAKAKGSGSIFRTASLHKAPSAADIRGVSKFSSKKGSGLKGSVGSKVSKSAPGALHKGKKDFMSEFSWLTKSGAKSVEKKKAVEYAWDKPAVKIGRRKREMLMGKGRSKGSRGGIRPLNYSEKGREAAYGP